MIDKMNVVDFQNLVCDLWIKEGENWEKDYQKEHQKDPSSFKTFSWGCRLMLKHLGINITND